MAASLGCWLRLQIPLRFGACMTLLSSAFSTLSCKTLSNEPSDDVATSFVAETFCGAVRGFGSLAGTWFTEGWVSTLSAKEARKMDGRARKVPRVRSVRVSIGGVGSKLRAWELWG